MSLKLALPALAVSTLLLGACSSSVEDSQASAQMQTQSKTLNVQVMYRDRSMLPPGSTLEVTLSDVSLADAPAPVLAKEVLTLDGAPPYTVSLEYDGSQIRENMRYSLRAKITNSGKLLYTSVQSNDPFGTVQSQDPVKVMVQKVGAMPNESFTNTYWKVITLDGQTVSANEQREPHIKFTDDGKTTGFLGCNQFSGQYVKAQHFGLRFKGVASTQRMCMDNMDTENAMKQALNNAFSYQIKGNKMVFFNEQGETLATFKAVNLT